MAARYYSMHPGSPEAMDGSGLVPVIEGLFRFAGLGCFEAMTRHPITPDDVGVRNDEPFSNRLRGKVKTNIHPIGTSVLFRNMPLSVLCKSRPVVSIGTNSQ